MQHWHQCLYGVVPGGEQFAILHHHIFLFGADNQYLRPLAPILRVSGVVEISLINGCQLQREF
jgi:hypothetical protein